MTQIGTFQELSVPVFDGSDISSNDSKIFAGYYGGSDIPGYLKLLPKSEVNRPCYQYHHPDGSTYRVANVGYSIIDDYEDNDLSEYNVKENTGGAYASGGKLHIHDFERVYSLPSFSPSLSAYPSYGNEIVFEIEWNSYGEGTRFLYGMQEDSPRQSNYQVLMYESGLLRLDKRDSNGDAITLTEINNLDLNEGNKYKVSVKWGTENKDHVISIGNKSISANDTSYMDGGFGYRCADGLDFEIDSIRQV